MRIALQSTDEVHRHLARKQAETFGVAVDVLFPKDPPPDDGYDAVILDLDHWDPSRRDAVLADLLAGPPPWRVVVVSHNLRPKEARALRRQQIAVFKVVGSRVFRALCAPVDAAARLTA